MARVEAADRVAAAVVVAAVVERGRRGERVTLPHDTPTPPSASATKSSSESVEVPVSGRRRVGSGRA